MTEYFSTKLRNPFLLLFITALVVRLLFFVLMLFQINPGDLSTILPDTINYSNSALSIGNGFQFQTEGVLLFGPGYPLFLAFLGSLLNLPPVGIIVVQILLSSLGSVLLAKLAYALTDDLRIALVAGYLNAFSLTSVSLANIMLSETLFWVLLCGGFYLAITGVRRQMFGRLIYAGLIFTCGATVRSVGQHLWIVLFILVLLYLWPSRKKDLRPFFKGVAAAVLVAIVMLSVAGLRAAQNEKTYGVPYQALAQPGGMAQLVRLSQSRINGITYVEASSKFDSVVASRTADSADYFRQFSRYAEESFSDLMENHTVTVAAVMIDNVVSNINGDDRLHHTLLPNTKKLSLGIFSRMHKWGLQYRMTLLVVIGLLMLLYFKQFRPAALLACLYLYFAASTGFSVWQGTRVFYPGQMAAAILSAHPLVAVFDWGRPRLKRLY